MWSKPTDIVPIARKLGPEIKQKYSKMYFHEITSAYKPRPSDDFLLIK